MMREKNNKHIKSHVRLDHRPALCLEWWVLGIIRSVIILSFKQRKSDKNFDPWAVAWCISIKLFKKKKVYCCEIHINVRLKPFNRFVCKMRCVKKKKTIPSRNNLDDSSFEEKIVITKTSRNLLKIIFFLISLSPSYFCVLKNICKKLSLRVQSSLVSVEHKKN